MKFAELTAARQRLSQMVQEKNAGLITKAITAPVKAVGKGLWGASQRAGGPLAPLVFGGAALGTVAVAKKSVGQAKNYAQGFNPQLQEAMVRG